MPPALDCRAAEPRPRRGRHWRWRSGIAGRKSCACPPARRKARRQTYCTVNGTSPIARAISAPPTYEASLAPWPKPKARWASGSPNTRKATEAGSSAVIASRIARMVSQPRPVGRRRRRAAKQSAAWRCQRDRDQRVGQDPHRVRVGVCGEPGALAANGGTAGELGHHDQRGCVTRTKPRVHLASRKVLPSPVFLKSKRGR